MQCKHCGTKLTRKDVSGSIVTCPQCGARFRLKSKAKSRTSRKKDVPALVIALAALIALLILTVCILYGQSTDQASTPVQDDFGAEEMIEEPVATPEPTATVEPTPLPTETPYEAASVHFRVVGDIIAHQHQLDIAKQKDGSYNFDSQFALIKDSLSCADYTIGNLETSITSGNYQGYPTFRCPAALLDTLKDCGFDMLTLANNHILDGDVSSLKYAVSEINARGLDYVGVYRSQEEAETPYIKEINGIKFGFLAYTYGVNGNRLAKLGSAGRFLVKTLDNSNFKKDIQRLREAGAEVVMCFPHWGIEYRKAPTDDQERWCKQLAAAGADIILGSHPHIVQGVKTYTQQTEQGEKTSLLCWSLGNFINNATFDYADCGIILDFTVARDPVTGICSVQDVAYVPTHTWNDSKGFTVLPIGEYYNNKPERMTQSNYDKMLSNINRIKKQAGTSVGVLTK